jgi:hypothetical protein
MAGGQASPAPVALGPGLAGGRVAVLAASWRTQRIRSAAAWGWSPNSCAIWPAQPRVPNRRTAPLIASATVAGERAAQGRGLVIHDADEVLAEHQRRMSGDPETAVAEACPASLGVLDGDCVLHELGHDPSVRREGG